MTFYLTLDSVYTGQVMSKGWEIIWIFWSLSNHPPPSQIFLLVSIFCCCSGTKLCLALWDPMEYSPPGFPILQYLLEFAQIRVYWVSDAIQPSYPLPPPPALSLFPHQGLFQWVCSSILGEDKLVLSNWLIFVLNLYKFVLLLRCLLRTFL